MHLCVKINFDVFATTTKVTYLDLLISKQMQRWQTRCTILYKLFNTQIVMRICQQCFHNESSYDFLAFLLSSLREVDM
jgi:hypothetical protein